MALDHARNVLAGILPENKFNLLYALQHLEPEHFRQEQYRILFALLDRFYQAATGVLTSSALASVLEVHGIEVTKSLLYESIFEQAVAQEISDVDFRWSVDQLKAERAKQLTGEAIAASFQILEQELTVGQQTYKGDKEAREFLYNELSKIDRIGGVDEAPEGDMRQETAALLKDYVDRKTGSIGQGIKTGIENLDAVTSGFQNGELVLIPGFTGHGKTQFCTQLAWNTATQQAKNVFFATSETLRVQIMRRLAARHSRLPQFNRPKGINTSGIKNGTLTSDDEEVYKAVLDDLKANPSYGSIYIAQIPRGASLSFLEARLKRQSQTTEYDLVIIDYLALLKPDTKRTSEREEFNAMIRDAKVMATTYLSGRGIPVVSPWAMSRDAWKGAVSSGEYFLASLADTSEAEKSSDLIVSLLRQDDTPQEVQMKVLKNRDGPLPGQFTLQVDYRNSFLGEGEGASSSEVFGSEEEAFATMWGE